MTDEQLREKLEAARFHYVEAGEQTEREFVDALLAIVREAQRSAAKEAVYVVEKMAAGAKLNGNERDLLFACARRLDALAAKFGPGGGT